MGSTIPGSDAASPIDLRQGGTGIDAVEATLDTVASDLRSLWSSALERGDFDEVTRLIEVSHAVHVAIIALRKDTFDLIGPEPTTSTSTSA